MFLVKPPLPPQQGVWVSKSISRWWPRSTQGLWELLFSSFFPTCFSTWFLEGFLTHKSSKIHQKLSPKSYFVLLWGDSFFEQELGRPKMRKSVFRLHHMLIFEDPRVRKFTPKSIEKHPQIWKNVNWNCFVFWHGKNEDVGAIWVPKMTPNFIKMWPKGLTFLEGSVFFLHFSPFRGATYLFVDFGRFVGAFRGFWGACLDDLLDGFAGFG